MASGIISGILFGGFLVLLVYVVGRLFSGSAHRTEVVMLNIPYNKALDLCVDSLHKISRSKIQEKNISLGKVVAKTGLSWKTWGDRIVFDVKAINDDRVEVTVSSKPILFTTLVDYGKNAENINRICEFLRSKQA